MTDIRFPVPSDPVPGELSFSHRNYELVGTSISALATAFCIDSLGLAVDMGRCSALLAAQETVLLTHCHSDHVAGLVAWLSAHTRRFQGSPARIVLPEQRRDALLGALEIWPELDGVRRRVDLATVIGGAAIGDRLVLGEAAWARGFETHHGVPSLGWSIGETGRSRPIFAFAGDGTIQPFVETPESLDAEVAIVDCSFVESGTRVAARLGGHGHLQDWIDLYPRLPCDVLVLSHLPSDVSVREIVSACDGLEADGPTIVPWAIDPAM
jgi:ribonuclease Z